MAQQSYDLDSQQTFGHDLTNASDSTLSSRKRNRRPPSRFLDGDYFTDLTGKKQNNYFDEDVDPPRKRTRTTKKAEKIVPELVPQDPGPESNDLTTENSTAAPIHRTRTTKAAAPKTTVPRNRGRTTAQTGDAEITAPVGRARGRTSKKAGDSETAAAGRARGRTNNVADNCESNVTVPRGRGRPRGRTNKNEAAAAAVPEILVQNECIQLNIHICDSEASAPVGRGRTTNNQGGDSGTTASSSKKIKAAAAEAIVQTLDSEKTATIGRTRGRTINQIDDSGTTASSSQTIEASAAQATVQIGDAEATEALGRTRGRTINQIDDSGTTASSSQTIKAAAAEAAVQIGDAATTATIGRTRGKTINQTDDSEATNVQRKRNRSCKAAAVKTNAKRNRARTTIQTVESETTEPEPIGRSRTTAPRQQGRTNKKVVGFNTVEDSEATPAANELEATSKSVDDSEASVPIEPESTSKNSDVTALGFDCLIEGDEQVFEVNRKLLSDKSNGFRTLFDVNSDECIEIEGILDRTLFLAIEFCHFSELKECSDEEACSLLYFADAWEIPELKDLLEQRLIAKIESSNVVAFAIAAKSAKLEELRNVCKYSILGILTTGENVDGYEKLDEAFKEEILKLLKSL